MKNKNALKVNKTLGVKILNESLDTLTVNKFTKKQVKELCIEDLIQHGRETPRLRDLVTEILKGRVK